MSKFFIFTLSLFILAVSGFCAPSRAYTADDYYKSGTDLYNQKQYAKAADYCKAAVQIDPTHWKAYQILGMTLYQMGMNTDALAAFDKSLALHDNPDLRKFADSIRNSAPPALPSGAGPSSADAAMAQYKQGQEMQDKARETLKQMGDNSSLTREERNLAKYGAPTLSRDYRRFQVAFEVGSPIVGGFDLGYSLDPMMNIGLSLSGFSEGDVYNKDDYFAIEPRVKWYSSPSDVSFFFGLGVLFGGITHTYTDTIENVSGTYPNYIYTYKTVTTSDNSSWIGPNFKVGFSVVDNAGLILELDWSVGALILTDSNYYGTYNNATGNWAYSPRTITIPAAIPSLRIGYVF